MVKASRFCRQHHSYHAFTLLIILLTKKVNINLHVLNENDIPLQNELAKKQATRNPLKIRD